jgi:hypothetical protein
MIQRNSFIFKNIINNYITDWKRIQRAQMKYLRTVKGCTRLDQIRNVDIRNEMGISPLSENIICKEWNIPAFHYGHVYIYIYIYIYNPEKDI